MDDLAEAALKRDRARAKVRDAAILGRHPALSFDQEDLAWAFRGHEAELDEAVQLAEQARENEKQRDRTRKEREKVGRLAERILAEWDAAEQAERRQRAEAEVRKRLGLDG